MQRKWVKVRNEESVRNYELANIRRGALGRENKQKKCRRSGNEIDLIDE